MTELLVVIAIMALLSAILLPALNKGRSRSQAISCLNNLRHLQLACQMYDDEHGVLPANNYLNGAKVGRISDVTGLSWCPGNPRVDVNTENIKGGLIFQYVKSTSIYRCPSDNARVQAITGGEPMLRTRSYSMSGSIGCDVTGAPTFRKSSEIVSPSPSDLFVFIDAHEDTLMDGHFTLSPDGKSWVDLPSGRHDPRAGNLSFADGHIERWNWAAPKQLPIPHPLPPEDIQDIRHIQSAMRQN